MAGQCFQSIDLSWPGLLGTFLIVLSLVFLGSGFGTQAWATGDLTSANDPVSVTMGVAEYCTGAVRCQTYEDNSFADAPNNLALVTRTRAMMSMMSVCLILNLVAVLHIGFSVGRKGKAELIRFVSLECVFTGIMEFIVILIWIVAVRDINDLTRVRSDGNTGEKFISIDFGYSFSLVVTAMIFVLISALLFHVESRSIVYSSLSNVNSGGAGMI